MKSFANIDDTIANDTISLGILSCLVRVQGETGCFNQDWVETYNIEGPDRLLANIKIIDVSYLLKDSKDNITMRNMLM